MHSENTKTSVVSQGEIALAIIFMALIFASGAFIALHRTSEKAVDPWRELIKVKVTGAIDKPGYYLLDRQNPNVGELKKQFTLEDGAEFPLADSEILIEGQRIAVEYPFVAVRITGAVLEETTLRLRRGEVLGDHLDRIPFSSEADPSKVKRKKVTGKKSQTISIPKKKILH